MNQPSTLIADIGGTNARFALADEKPGHFSCRQVLQCADYETVEQALAAYLEQQGVQHLDAICFAAAGPIQNQTIRMANNHWFIDINQLSQTFGAHFAKLLNDFEANAYALPYLTQDQLTPIGGDWPLPTGEHLNLGIVGPGSGLGVGGLLKRRDAYYPLVTEAGHAGFSPENRLQLSVLNCLFDKYDRVSNERLLSGPGLVNLYQALCKLENAQVNKISAKEIGEHASDGSDPLCVASLNLFFEILGQVAGDIALTQAAFDGIYIGGGISQRYPKQLSASKFRKSFELKGRHSHLIENTPTWLITEPNPGLIGASSYAYNNFT